LETWNAKHFSILSLHVISKSNQLLLVNMIRIPCNRTKFKTPALFVYTIIRFAEVTDTRTASGASLPVAGAGARAVLIDLVSIICHSASASYFRFHQRVLQSMSFLVVDIPVYLTLETHYAIFPAARVHLSCNNCVNNARTKELPESDRVLESADSLSNAREWLKFCVDVTDS